MRFLLDTTVAAAVLVVGLPMTMMLVVQAAAVPTLNKNHVQKRNLQGRTSSSGAAGIFNLQENTACYESLNRTIETYSSLDWWNSVPTQTFIEPTSFFKNRLAFEPLKDSTTMIAGVLFSFSNHTTLKMSVLFPPLFPEESRVAKLLLTKRDTGELVATQECDIIPNIWKCGFRVDASDFLLKHKKDQDYAYEIQYQPNSNAATSVLYTYDGVIPVPSDNPRIIGLGCFGRNTKIEKANLVAAVNAVNPDLIVLQGDQTYFHHDLGFGFLHLVYAISEMTRSVPTIVQMDDHDYGEGNLWGAGGSPEGQDDSGAGFHKPVCLINAIQELGMGHNPDPATTETLLNGITIHYTNYILGRVDFAVLEARKFKNLNKGDSLLGDEQEEWLQDWCDSNRDLLKVVLTQTPFANLATHETRHSGGIHEITSLPTDPNGFPEAGRTRAMEILSGCSNLVLSGDQHLGIGVTYDDYGIAECASPAAVNTVWWRINQNQVGGTHMDLLGHEYTLKAVWNVDSDLSNKYNQPWKTLDLNAEVKKARADGFLLVDITNMEATCSAHSYQTGILPSPAWDFTVPVSLPSL